MSQQSTHCTWPLLYSSTYHEPSVIITLHNFKIALGMCFSPIFSLISKPTPTMSAIQWADVIIFYWGRALRKWGARLGEKVICARALSSFYHLLYNPIQIHFVSVFPGQETEGTSTMWCEVRQPLTGIISGFSEFAPWLSLLSPAIHQKYFSQPQG